MIAECTDIAHHHLYLPVGFWKSQNVALQPLHRWTGQPQINAAKVHRRVAQLVQVDRATPSQHCQIAPRHCTACTGGPGNPRSTLPKCAGGWHNLYRWTGQPQVSTAKLHQDIAPLAQVDRATPGQRCQSEQEGAQADRATPSQHCHIAPRHCTVCTGGPGNPRSTLPKCAGGCTTRTGGPGNPKSALPNCAKTLHHLNRRTRQPQVGTAKACKGHLTPTSVLGPKIPGGIAVYGDLLPLSSPLHWGHLKV
jgi:hypothetical protein